MPQLNGGGGDDLGANDEMISFKDEGEQEEKISENVSAERDLDDVKSSLVNESESSSDSEVRPHTHAHNVLRAHCSRRRKIRINASKFQHFLPVRVSPPVSKQRGAPKPEPTQKVMRKRGTTLVKVKERTQGTRTMLHKPGLVIVSCMRLH